MEQQKEIQEAPSPLHGTHQPSEIQPVDTTETKTEASDQEIQSTEQPATDASEESTESVPQMEAPGESKEEPTAGQKTVEDVSMEEVRSWATAAWKQLTKNLKFPNVAVGRLRFDRSTILAYTTKEDIPREFLNTKGVIQLGSGYHTLEIDMHADAHNRHPDSIKWTKNLPEAPIHLRYLTLDASSGTCGSGL